MTAETWTAARCAQEWGVKPGTWAGYVSRGQAPPPLPAPDADGHKVWDADAVRSFPRPGVGRSRSGAGPEAEALTSRMRAVAAELEELRGRQRALLREGRAAGLEIAPMAKALGISRQTAYSWLDGG